MPAQLVPGEDFERDVQSQVDWLEQRLDLARLRRFGEELRQLEAVLVRFPELGVPVELSGAVFRKALFSKLPYVVWSWFDAGRGEVHLLRLFHAHQERGRERPARRSRKPRRG